MLPLLLLILSFEPLKVTCFCHNISWTGGEAIQWPTTTIEQMYKSTKMFVSKNVLATRFAVTNDKAFIAMPRFKSGIPFTLGKMNLRTRYCEASLKPFPSWSLQEEGNCKSMQSVVDVFLDSRGVLWVLDTGIVNSLDAPIRLCPPKVIALNTKTGKHVRSISLGDLATERSRLQYLVVETMPSNRVFLYISDAASRSVIVYDALAGLGYRLLLPSELSWGAASRDVLYLGLIRAGARESSGGCLLLSYLGGRNTFALGTRQLESGLPVGSLADLGPKTDKIIFLGADPKDTRLYWRREARSEIYSWDIVNCSRIEENESEIVYSGKKCELPTHVVPDGRLRRMKILESTFPDYFHGYVGCGVNHVLGTF